ncbi:MAG: MFS transporter [Haloarculaceae archaeon]
MAADEATDVSPTVPWRSATLYVILASSLIGVMGVSLVSPLLPELRRVFAVSDARIGLVMTAYTLPGVFLTPFVGLIADRIGRRRTIVPLLFVFGVGGAGITLASSFTQLLALRLLQGVGASALVTLAITLVGDFYDGARQNTVLGVNASTMEAGAAAYPLVGGVLATIRWNVPFLFFGTSVLVGLFAIAALPEPEGRRSTDVRTYLGRLRDAALDPRALVLFGTIFALFFVLYGAVMTAVPLLLSDEFGLSSGTIGLVVGMVSVSTAVVSWKYGWLSQRRSGPELIALGFGMVGASLLGVWLSSSAVAVGASLLAFGVGFGIVMPSIDVTVMSLVSNRLRAGVMSLRTSVLRLGQTLGPVSFTYVAGTAFASSTAGYRVLILAVGLASLASGLLAYPLVRRR